ncbi:hypothetical protein, partial [[Limnothrix rosea] IAM M-220]|uniref:hypothetical protein n=1 Tax=[Limnothrix rosea] IAM M-220 TaxID=454133 RepID=UPI00095B9C50
MNLIDFRELNKLYDGDQTFQQEIVTSFVERIPAYLDCLRVSLHQQDVESLLIYACQLRAVAKRCCVNEVHVLCGMLEKQVRIQKFASAAITLQRIQKIMSHVQAEYLRSQYRTKLEKSRRRGFDRN